MNISFRKATLKDAGFLLEWRNDPETRKYSHCENIVPYESHIFWLRQAIKNQRKELLVVERDRIPVGTIRKDHIPHGYVLSWTVAPESRKMGIGKLMLKKLVDGLDKPAIAEIKYSNEASIRMAEYAGMKKVFKDGCILYYRADK